jgi:hypothetical protein
LLTKIKITLSAKLSEFELELFSSRFSPVETSLCDTVLGFYEPSKQRKRMMRKTYGRFLLKNKVYSRNNYNSDG